MARKTYNVIIAKRADTMLLMHTEFLAKASPTAARRLISEFKKVKQRLNKDPFQFPFADDLDVPGIAPRAYRKCLFYGRYKAIFLVENNDIFIDAIIDCRQDNTDIFHARNHT